MLFRTANKKMFAGMLMFIIVFFFKKLQFNSLFIVVLQIVIGSFFYIGALIAMKDTWILDICQKAIKKIKHN